MEQVKQRRPRLGARAWHVLLERFSGSGLTAGAFCEQEGLSAKTFYRWRRLLQEGAPTRSMTKQAPPSTSFVDLGALVQGGAPSPRLDLKLDLGGGLTLHLVRS
jgi:hypothetical protein